MYNIELRAPYQNELYHFGKKGMRWGVRRYQNPDGSLTPAGQVRYNKKAAKAFKKHVQSLERDAYDAQYAVDDAERLNKRADAYIEKYRKKPTEKNRVKAEKAAAESRVAALKSLNDVNTVKRNLEEAKAIYDKVTSKNKDIELYSVPDSVLDAGKRYSDRASNIFIAGLAAPVAAAAIAGGVTYAVTKKDRD